LICNLCDAHVPGDAEALAAHRADHPPRFIEVVPSSFSEAALSDWAWIAHKSRTQGFVPPTDTGIDFARGELMP